MTKYRLYRTSRDAHATRPDGRAVMRRCSVTVCALLLASFGLAAAPTEALAQAAVSPHNFPYGYPFPDYPLEGASHPRQSSDYLDEEPHPTDELKRVGQHALRLIQTGRAEEAVEYVDRYMEEHPGLMDQEALFMRSVAQARLGRVEEAARSMEQAIEEADLPPERFIAGPRRLLAPLHRHTLFIDLWEEQNEKLVHGPMLGDLTDHSAKVWVRTVSEQPVRIAVSESPDMDVEIILSDPVITRAEDDYTAEVTVERLKPDVRYHYEVLLGSEQNAIRSEHQQFRTYPRQHHASRFHVAFGGCAGYVPHNERMWKTIARFDPRAFLTLGDNVYIDDPESPDQARYLYYQRQSRSEFRRLVGGSPVYAIWDDHDFAMDDSWGGPTETVPYWKPMVWEIFQQNWANPASASRNRPGGWFDYHIGDVQFILLDGRYYREDAGRFGGDGVEHPSMLGPEQLDWLKETLAQSEATFKVLVSSVPWHDEAKGRGQRRLDGWFGYRGERAEIFSWIDEREIEGVILLSSDRHRSDAWRTEREEGYDLYEFSSGQLTNQHTHDVLEASLFGYNEKPSFGLLHFNTQVDDPSVTYEIVDIDGAIQESLRVRHSELRY